MINNLYQIQEDICSMIGEIKDKNPMIRIQLEQAESAITRSTTILGVVEHQLTKISNEKYS